MVTVLWTGSDRFGHAVSTSLHGLPPNFTHTLKICLGRFLSQFQSARLIGSGGNSPSSRFSWRKVWTGVNWCELVWSATSFRRSSTTDTSIESSQLAEFECEISPGYDVRKKIMAFNNSGTKAVACDLPQKGVNYHLSSPELDKPYVAEKLSISEAYIYAVSARLAKR